MAADDIKQQLITYLSDAHSLEQNALAQLRTGAEQAGYAQLRDAFQEHLEETDEHARLISERLESYGESPSKLKDLAQKGGAMMGGMMAKTAPDTTGKLAIQAYAFEHVEIAAYRMLCVVAERAGDAETLRVARQILQQEEEAAHKLDGLIEPVAAYDLEAIGVAA